MPKDVEIVKKVDDKFKGKYTIYKCARCSADFKSKHAKKYCSDDCREKGPKLEKNTGGRIAYHTAAELAEELEEFFSIEDKDRITPAGLLLFLGISKDIWQAYATKPNLKRLVETAQLKLEHYGTKRMYRHGRVADIFFMKNMGWSDVKQIEKKEHLLISNRVKDDQAEKILERFQKRIKKGKNTT